MTRLTRFTKRTAGLLGLAGCLAGGTFVLGLTGCSTYYSRQGDATISSRVERNLAEDPVYKFNMVNVNTYHGVVQLNGFTNTKDQKDRAGDIAKKVEGVRDVDNKITVKE